MQSRFQREEYEEVGVNVGRFSEGIVHILRLEISGEIRKENVREFSQECIKGDFATGYSPAIKQHVPNMLHTAYDIRSNRNAAHMNLETSVNRSDARLGIALCSSMLIELIREFVDTEEIEDVNSISRTIDKLSTPVEENPLEQLVASRYEFNKEQTAEMLNGIISIVEEESDIRPGPDFFNLEPQQQVVALALGRLAGYDLGYLKSVGANQDWYKNNSSLDINSLEGVFNTTDILVEDFSVGGYYLPGYQFSEALKILSSSD